MAEEIKDKIKLCHIAKQWDIIAPLRNLHLEQGNEISFYNVLVPSIIDKIKHCDCSFVVDCGCGTGVLTSIVSEYAEIVVGIDISKCSIDIASEKYFNNPKLKFYNCSVEDYSKKINKKASLCITNMVLQDTTSLDDNLLFIYNILNKGGKLIITITHPCYWPIYKGYFDENWFNYKKEIIVESDFSTSNYDKIGNAIHIHRSLSTYINSILGAGFNLKESFEPYPVDMENMKDYIYNYPRFIGFVCEK